MEYNIKQKISTELGSEGISRLFKSEDIIKQGKYRGIENVTVVFKQQQKLIY